MILMCVPKTDILVSCLTGSMNELTDGLVDESPTNRLDDRMDIYRLVVSFEVPEDVSVRISCALRDAVYPIHKQQCFVGTCCFEKKAAGSSETSISMYLHGVTFQQIVI